MNGINDVVACREVVQVDWSRDGRRCRVIVWTPKDWRPGKQSTAAEDDAGREESLIFEQVGGEWSLMKRTT